MVARKLGQADLHHVVRAIYIARAGTGPLPMRRPGADLLMVRRAEQKRLGSDDPLMLATVMHESLTDEEYGQTARKLDGIRLVPLDKHLVRTQKGNINQFPQMVKFCNHRLALMPRCCRVGGFVQNGRCDGRAGLKNLETCSSR